MPKKKYITVAITGGIATGKSTVSKYLKSKNYYVISADEVYHSLIESNKTLINKIINTFGKDICVNHNNNSTTKKIDLKKLADIVFKNKKKLLQLNKISHPFVYRAINKELKEAAKTNNIIFLDIPLLFESNYQNKYDIIITIYASKINQIKRLKHFRKLNDDQINERINAQLPIEYKIQNSDFAISNNSTKKKIYKKIDSLLKKIYHIYLS